MEGDNNQYNHYLLLLVQILIFFLRTSASSVPAIIVFGDSSVDPGNNNQIPTIARSNFVPYGRDFVGGEPTGRFCNGRLATDFVSEALGLKATVPAYLDPAYSIKDFTTGVSFASAGTGYDNTTSQVLSVIPLWKEVAMFREYQQMLRLYVGDAKANDTINEALYIISIGTNDFLENYYAVPAGQSYRYTVEEYEDFLVGIAKDFITEIYHLGARKIDLTGLPPMGCMPLVRFAAAMSGRPRSCNEEYNKVARDFNGKLQGQVVQLSSELPGIRIVYSDVYDLFQKVIQQPDVYGFEEVMRGCCATGMFEMGYACDRWNPFSCEDAAKYAFWDAFHPSEAMNWIIANHAINSSLAKFL